MIPPEQREIMRRVGNALHGVSDADVMGVCAAVVAHTLSKYPAGQRKRMREIYDRFINKMLRSSHEYH